ncbi:hypothetical protein AYI68_g4264 [Smittium mucronatum]|uniref:Uncharacterized protein n=1 Tax=Smittium mucronatum TaxID=133383 RepID=A0A1R0GXL3_9FUNG|nr:hypothetical protein AYI68_g4264 [Smittium mucronatum]
MKPEEDPNSNFEELNNVSSGLISASSLTVQTEEPQLHATSENPGNIFSKLESPKSKIKDIQLLTTAEIPENLLSKAESPKSRIKDAQLSSAAEIPGSPVLKAENPKSQIKESQLPTNAAITESSATNIESLKSRDKDTLLLASTEISEAPASKLENLKSQDKGTRLLVTTEISATPVSKLDSPNSQINSLSLTPNHEKIEGYVESMVSPFSFPSATSYLRAPSSKSSNPHTPNLKNRNLPMAENLKSNKNSTPRSSSTSPKEYNRNKTPSRVEASLPEPKSNGLKLSLNNSSGQKTATQPTKRLIKEVPSSNSNPPISNVIIDSSENSINPRRYSPNTVRRISKKHRESHEKSVYSLDPRFKKEITPKSSPKEFEFSQSIVEKTPTQIKEFPPRTFERGDFSFDFSSKSHPIKVQKNKKPSVKQLNFVKEHREDIQEASHDLEPSEIKEEKNINLKQSLDTISRKKPKLNADEKLEKSLSSDLCNCFQIDIDSYFLPKIVSDKKKEVNLKTNEIFSGSMNINNLIHEQISNDSNITSLSSPLKTPINFPKSNINSDSEIETEIESDSEDYSKNVKKSDDVLAVLNSIVTFSFAVFSPSFQPVKLLDLKTENDNLSVKSVTVLKSSYEGKDEQSWANVYHSDKFNSSTNVQNSINQKTVVSRHYTTHTTSSLIKSTIPLTQKGIGHSPRTRPEIPFRIIQDSDSDDPDVRLSKNIVNSVKDSRKSSIVGRNNSLNSKSASQIDSTIDLTQLSSSINPYFLFKSTSPNYHLTEKDQYNSYIINNRLFLKFSSIGRFKVVVKLSQEFKSHVEPQISSIHETIHPAEKDDIFNSFHKPGYDIFRVGDFNFFGLPSCTYVKINIRVPYIKVKKVTNSDQSANYHNTEANNPDSSSDLPSVRIKNSYLIKILDQDSNGINVSDKTSYIENSLFVVKISTETKINSQSHKLFLNRCKKKGANTIRKTISNPNTLQNLVTNGLSSMESNTLTPNASSPTNMFKSRSLSVINDSILEKSNKLTKSPVNITLNESESEKGCDCHFHQRTDSDSSQNDDIGPLSADSTTSNPNENNHPCFDSTYVLSTSFSFASTRYPLSFSFFSKKPSQICEPTIVEHKVIENDVTPKINKTPTKKNSYKFYSMLLLFIFATFLAISSIILPNDFYSSSLGTSSKKTWKLKAQTEFNNIYFKLAAIYNDNVYSRICLEDKPFLSLYQYDSTRHFNLNNMRYLFCKNFYVRTYPSIDIAACNKEGDLFCLFSPSLIEIIECNYNPTSINPKFNPRIATKNKESIKNSNPNHEHEYPYSSKGIDGPENIKTIKLVRLNKNLDDDIFNGFNIIVNYVKRVSRFLYIFFLW